MFTVAMMSQFELFAFLGVIGLMIAGSTQAVRSTQRKRELEHQERMKAMEMGLVPQSCGMNWPAAAVCIAIGAGVPVGSFLVVLIASMAAPISTAIWLAPVFVSLAAVGNASKLALRLTKPQTRSESPLGQEPSSQHFGKPVFDPDAFDVVGSRG